MKIVWLDIEYFKFLCIPFARFVQALAGQRKRASMIPCPWGKCTCKALSYLLMLLAYLALFSRLRTIQQAK